MALQHHNYDERHDVADDDKHGCANYPHSKSSVVITRHESLRKCKSESELLSCRADARRKINRSTMGIGVSRWHSADNLTVTTERDFVYRPLSKVNVLVNQDEVMDEEGDYDLLESESAASETADDEECNDNNLVTNNCDDGQVDNAENRRSSTATVNTLQLNDMPANDDCYFVIRKFSTLPRAKSRESLTRSENGARKSCKLSSRSSEKDVQEVTKLERGTLDESVDESFVRVKKSDKMPFQCTTLPKANTARSRLNESHLRHSLRQNIDFSDASSKNFNEHCCSGSPRENNATFIVPTSSRTESASGTDSTNKVKRSRSNLSWLRKSMKKLKSFQMPSLPPPQHQQIESTSPNCVISQSTDSSSPNHQIQSSSIDTNPEKENLSLENHFSCGELTQHAANENIEAIATRSSENPDIFNVVLQQSQESMSESRPRQYGRRSNPIRIASMVAESVNHSQAARIIAHHQERPSSAPAAAAQTTRMTTSSTNSAQRNAHRPRQSLPSEPSSVATSRNSSPVSMVSSTGSSSLPDAVDTNIRPRFHSSLEDDDERDQNENGGESKTSWPHLLSRPICCVFCTLGLFNISRFAIFSVHFGANFLVQFLLLSFVFGIPFLWLQMVLGHKIKGGIVTMYRITPICKGIGISLMIAHCIISLYSSVSIAWILIYLRDSMISSDDHYVWEERFDTFRGYQNISQLRLSENIADYFNGVVLQRLNGLASTHDGKMRFQLAFTLSIVWILIFIMLCRGIRSLGKIAIGLCLFSFLCLAAVCIKFLTLLNFETVQDIFPATDWQEFFANSNSWSVASQEIFLTWGLCGVSIYSIYCKDDKNQRLNHYILRREALLIVFLTLFGLFLGGVLGSTCVIILKLNGFNYFPASFENPKNDIFLWPMHFASLPSFHHSIPSKWITRYSNVIGESFERPIFVNQQGVQVYKESGFKPIRLITEILPSTLAISSRIEPVWGTLAFLCLFLFGILQLAVMWKPISGAIGNSTSAILLSCVTGLFLGVPLTTDNGILILHFFDYTFGGSWFLPVLWSCYLLSIFMVRGRPFTSDILVKELRLTETLSAFLAFSWNVLMPVGLLLLSVMEYKKSHSTEFFHQRNIHSLSHLSNWPMWVKQVGGLLQVSLLILLPCAALVQIYIYLSKGPRDILERIERLFRPPMESSESTPHLPIRRLCQTNFNQPHSMAVSSNENNSINLANDAPPKYSPPPSYGRAMGLRVAAKVIRNSIRRSVRRFRRPEISQMDTQNIPTVSSVVSSSETRAQSQPPAFVQNINEFISTSSSFIRQSFRRNNTRSTEQLVLSEIDTPTAVNNEQSISNV